VLSGPWRLQEADVLPGEFTVFLQYDRVCTRGEGGPGKNPDGCPVLDGSISSIAGGDGIYHGQCHGGGGDVFGPDCIAIHGGVVPGRKWAARSDFLGADSTHALGQRDPFRIERHDLVEHPLQCLIDI